MGKLDININALNNANRILQEVNLNESGLYDIELVREAMSRVDLNSEELNKPNFENITLTAYMRGTLRSLIERYGLFETIKRTVLLANTLAPLEDQALQKSDREQRTCFFCTRGSVINIRTELIKFYEPIALEKLKTILMGSLNMTDNEIGELISNQQYLAPEMEILHLIGDRETVIPRQSPWFPTTFPRELEEKLESNYVNSRLREMWRRKNVAYEYLLDHIGLSRLNARIGRISLALNSMTDFSWLNTKANLILNKLPPIKLRGYTDHLSFTGIASLMYKELLHRDSKFQPTESENYGHYPDYGTITSLIFSALPNTEAKKYTDISYFAVITNPILDKLPDKLCEYKNKRLRNTMRKQIPGQQKMEFN